MLTLMVLPTVGVIFPIHRQIVICWNQIVHFQMIKRGVHVVSKALGRVVMGESWWLENFHIYCREYAQRREQRLILCFIVPVEKTL
jgi:hypothetical protein